MTVLCTARVAPEKAVFRPALPLHFLQPEFTGEHVMARKPYGEQLKHPLWQKKRLEILERAGWKCESCEDKEKTLHVHHRRYVKGREVWDYDSNELEALCEDCHSTLHQDKERLEAVIAQFPSVLLAQITSLLIGYGDEYVPVEFWNSATDTQAAMGGQLAWYMRDLDVQDAMKASAVIRNTDPDTFMEIVRAREQDYQRFLDAAEKFDELTKQLSKDVRL